MAERRVGNRFDPVRELRWQDLPGPRGGSNYINPDDDMLYTGKGRSDNPSYQCCCRVVWRWFYESVPDNVKNCRARPGERHNHPAPVKGAYDGYRMLVEMRIHAATLATSDRYSIEQFHRPFFFKWVVDHDARLERRYQQLHFKAFWRVLSQCARTGVPFADYEQRQALRVAAQRVPVRAGPVTPSLDEERIRQIVREELRNVAREERHQRRDE